MIFSFVRAPFFVAAMIFGALANGFAFFVLYRMRSLGYHIGVWRTTRDWALYREYWRVAPANNWSRVPIPLGIVSFAIAAALIMAAVWR